MFLDKKTHNFFLLQIIVKFIFSGLRENQRKYMLQQPIICVCFVFSRTAEGLESPRLQTLTSGRTASFFLFVLIFFFAKKRLFSGRASKNSTF